MRAGNLNAFNSRVPTAGNNGGFSFWRRINPFLPINKNNALICGPSLLSAINVTSAPDIRSISRAVRATGRSDQVDCNGNRHGGISKSWTVLNSAEALLNFAMSNFLPIALVSGVALGFLSPRLGCLAHSYSLSKFGTAGIFLISGITLQSREIRAAAEAWPAGMFGLLGCGHGLPGIFACLEGASVIHFQDFNAEVLQCLTIPNVNANLRKEPAQVATTSGTERISEADVRFFAGDWSEVHQYLLHLRDNEDENSLYLRLEQDSTSGYDIILMAETVYSISSLQNLYAVIKKCLSRPNGVVYMAAKKHYFGVGGGTRQFLSVVGKDGVMVPNLIAEIADGSSNVREVWKLSFK